MAAPRPQRPTRDAGEGASARPAFVPAKKKGAPPALTIGLLVLIILLAGVFGWAYMRKQNLENQPAKIDETTNVDEWSSIRGKIREAEKMYRDAMALRTDDTQVKLFQTKVEDTMGFIGGVLEEFDMMLEGVRDPETGDLPPEYNGYNNEAKPLVVWLNDLSHVTNFNVTDGSDE